MSEKLVVKTTCKKRRRSYAGRQSGQTCNQFKCKTKNKMIRIAHNSFWEWPVKERPAWNEYRRSYVCVVSINVFVYKCVHMYISVCVNMRIRAACYKSLRHTKLQSLIRINENVSELIFYMQSNDFYQFFIFMSLLIYLICHFYSQQ